MKDLKGKYVLVAGGCGLIGRAIVKEFESWSAAVSTLDVAAAATFVGDIRSSVLLHVLTRARYDVFINSVYPRGTADHLRSFLMPTGQVAEHMKQCGGSIVNIASIYGIVGPTLSLYDGTDVSIPPIGYSAVKGAIIALSRNVAAQYAQYGVRVNCVSPGGVIDGQDPEFVKRYCEKTPMGRMATPEDIAKPVAFLASDAAGYITGVNLEIDGGYCAI